MTRWYEDIEPGDRFNLGEHKFNEREIVEFGLRYDNQYFHTDPELAKHSHFGNNRLRLAYHVRRTTIAG